MILWAWVRLEVPTVDGRSTRFAVRQGRPQRCAFSRLQSHAAHEVGVARVAAEVFITVITCNKWESTAAVLDILLKPCKCLIPFAQSGIHRGQILSDSLAS